MRTPLEEINPPAKARRGSGRNRTYCACTIRKLLGPRCWRWASPWIRNDSHRNSGFDATKYSATSRSGKGIVCRIDGQRPNVATRRNETAAHVIPSVAVVRRPESSACCPCENVTPRIGYHRIYVRCRYAAILFHPAITVVSRSEDTAAHAHESIGRSEDVAVGADCQPGNVGRG
jgi:hypothetical protein